MNSFVYDIWTKVYFGKEELKHLGEEIKKYGSTCLFLYDGDYIKKNGIYDLVYQAAQRYEFKVIEFTEIQPNPRHTDVEKGIAVAKKENCDVILAVGGGSTIDSAKAIATGALMNVPIWDVVIGKYEVERSLPIITISTISATGSEMNTGGVISNLQTHDKQSLRRPSQRPRVTFLNPEYTYTVGKYQTACGTVDILCHLMETYFTEDDSMYMLDSLTEGLIRTTLKYGPIAYHDPTNYEARANLMWTAPWAINDFLRYDKKKTWSMHPIEHEISAYYDITHGLGLAILMPRFLRHIIDEKSLCRFEKLGKYAFDLPADLVGYEMAEAVINKIEKLAYQDLNLTSNFTQLGIDETYFAEIAAKLTKEYGYFDSGYRTLSKDDIITILKNCL